MSRRPARTVSVLLLVAGLHLLPAVAQDQPATGAGDVSLEATEIQGLEARVAALLVSGQSGGDVSGDLIWTIGTVPGSDSDVSLLFYTEIDGNGLLEDDLGSSLLAEVYVYLLDSDERVVEHLAQVVHVSEAGRLLKVLQSGLRFTGRFSVEPGPYSLRVHVRNHNTGRFYQASSPVEVPEAGGEGAGILPPLFRDSGGLWVEAHQSGFDETPGLLQLEGEESLPAALPLLTAGRRAALYAAGWSWPRGGALRAHLEDVQDRLVTDLELETRSVPDLARQLEVVHLECTLPADLIPGRYTLVLSVTGEGFRSLADRRWPVLVVSPDVLAAGGPAGRSARELAESLERGAAYEEYITALGLLVEGQRQEAVDTLARVESDALQRSLYSLHRVNSVERRVARDLAGDDVEPLVAIVLLHHDVFHRHEMVADYLLESHARELTSDLAELAWRRSRTEPARELAFWVLVSLAYYHIENGGTRPAAELLERALEVWEDHEVALLTLGAIHERMARYKQAAQVFKRLASVRPELAEGRLRYAVNLVRMGREKAARRELGDLLESQQTGWIRAVAYRELALLELADERMESVESLLRQAAAEYPDEQSFPILLAHVLDRRVRRPEAIAVVDAVAPPSDPRVPSAVWRYSAWPEVGIDAVRAAIADQAAKARPILAERLQSLQPLSEEPAS